MSKNDEMDAAFTAEREAWAAARRSLPGQRGHDPQAWQEWERRARAADARLGASEGPPGAAGDSELPPRQHSAVAERVAELACDMGQALQQAYEALDALAAANLGARGATGASLRRSLDAMARLIAQANADLQISIEKDR